MTNPKILAFSGSARAGSLNAKLVMLVVRELALADAEVTVISLADYAMPIYNGDDEDADGVPEAARKLKAMFLAHQGIFVACPEYNASVTPLLKNTLDWITRVHDDTPAISAFRNRVFGLGSAAGGFGGLRGLMALRQILEIGLGATVIPEQILVRSASSAFDDGGNLIDEATGDKVRETAARLVVEARRYTDGLS